MEIGFVNTELSSTQKSTNRVRRKLMVVLTILLVGFEIIVIAATGVLISLQLSETLTSGYYVDTEK